LWRTAYDGRTISTYGFRIPIRKAAAGEASGLVYDNCVPNTNACTPDGGTTGGVQTQAISGGSMLVRSNPR
jgi:hypothetical protein